MASLNFKHLRYFWMVAKAGSIARASERLHLTPQSISGQLGELEDSLGVKLLRRVGRGLELTEMGRRIFSYADEIFALSDELLEVAVDQTMKTSLPFRIGIADSVPKSVAYRVVEPALRLGDPVRLICREGRLASLLAEMAVHRLDLVIADRPMPTNLNVRGYNHLLGESNLTVFAAPGLVQSLSGTFPHCLTKRRFCCRERMWKCGPNWFSGSKRSIYIPASWANLTTAPCSNSSARPAPVCSWRPRRSPTTWVRNTGSRPSD